MVRVFAPGWLLLYCVTILAGWVCSAQTRVARPTAEYDLEIVAQEYPAQVREHETIDVPLVLRNQGSVTWHPDRGFNVSYHWRSADGAKLVWDGERTPLPVPVQPGQEVALEARLQVPPGSGQRLLQWDVVHESVTWISEKDPTPATNVPITVLPGDVSHAFTVTDSRIPRIVPAGGTRTLRVVIRNDGTEIWDRSKEINLSYHWEHDHPKRSVFDGLRTPLPRRVKPGQQVALAATVQAPSRPGLYRMQWDMVEENVTWFTDRDPTDEPKLNVLVVAIAPAAVAFAIAMACLAVAFLALWRSSLPAWVSSAASVSDVIWLASALLLKQEALLDSVTDLPPPGSPWLASLAIIVLAMMALLLPARLRPWSAVAINASASALILSDLLHHRFFGDVISVASSRSAGQLGDVLASVVSLWSAGDVWFVLDLLPGIGIALAVGGLLKRVGTRASRRFALLLLPLLIASLASAWRVAARAEGAVVQVFQNVFVARELGLLNYHAWDAWSHLRSHVAPRELPPERRAEIEQWFRSHAPQRAGSGPWFGAARGKNLIMLQVESLQAFVVGMTIEGQEVTPNLNRMKRSGTIWFAECGDQTMQGRTSDGELTTQVSLLPLPEGAAAFRFGTNGYHALGDILAERGYQTLSAVPFSASFWNRRVTHPEYGFRTTYFGDSFAEGTRVGWGLNDRDFLLQMAPRLAALRKPFAAFLITLSNHHPFESFPDELKRLKLGRQEGTPLGNYLHSMHHFDAALGVFLVELERRGLASETVFAAWGDHTAGFSWDADLAAVLGRRPTEADYYVLEKVPVLMIVPGSAETLPGESDVLCGQTDLAPTLLALLGVDPAAYPFVGRNLLGNPQDGAVVQRYGVWRDRSLLFLPKGPALEDGFCYDLSTLHRLPPERCRDGYLKTQIEMKISRDVIEHDLQIPLTRSLQQE